MMDGDVQNEKRHSLYIRLTPGRSFERVLNARLYIRAYMSLLSGHTGANGVAFSFVGW